MPGKPRKTKKTKLWGECSRMFGFDSKDCFFPKFFEFQRPKQKTQTQKSSSNTKKKLLREGLLARTTNLPQELWLAIFLLLIGLSQWGGPRLKKDSWIELSLDVVATHGWQPGWIHSELTLGKLARRFQVFVVRLLKANHIPILAISSLHLSEFGFDRVASIYLHKKFVFPDKVLAFLLPV